MNPRLEPIIGRLRIAFGHNCRQEDANTWRFEVLTEGGRSQVVTLHLKELHVAGADLSRLVAFSPVGPAHTALHYELLLRRNADIDVGAIAIEDVWTHDELRLPFVVFRASHLVATADYPEIWELITKTGEYADKLEQTLYTKDTY